MGNKLFSTSKDFTPYKIYENCEVILLSSNCVLNTYITPVQNDINNNNHFWSKDGKLLITYSLNYINIYEVDNLYKDFNQEQKSEIKSESYSYLLNGYKVLKDSASNKKNLFLSNKEANNIPIIEAVFISNSRALVAISLDNLINIFAINYKINVEVDFQTFLIYEQDIEYLKISPSGDYLAVKEPLESTISIYDISKFRIQAVNPYGHNVAKLQVFDSSTSSISIESHKNYFKWAYCDYLCFNTINHYEVNNMYHNVMEEKLTNKSKNLNGKGYTCCDLSNDGSRIAIASPITISIRKFFTNEDILVWGPKKQKIIFISSLCFSNDGKKVMYTDNIDIIRVLDIEDGKNSCEISILELLYNEDEQMCKFSIGNISFSTNDILCVSLNDNKNIKDGETNFSMHLLIRINKL